MALVVEVLSHHDLSEMFIHSWAGAPPIPGTTLQYAFSIDTRDIMMLYTIGDQPKLI